MSKKEIIEITEKEWERVNKMRVLPKRKTKKKKKKKVKVKTVYSSASHREPDISEYPNKKQAESMIETTLRWGMGIVSCEIVD